MEKREDRKDDRICGKNEESIGGSMSSFEEDTGRNKKICG